MIESRKPLKSESERGFLKMEKKMFQTMSAQEQGEALKQFKTVLNLKKISYNTEHANPLKQYCYISSGDVEGIYFPNSEIFYNDYFNFVCVAKQDSKLGIVAEYKENYFKSKILSNDDFIFYSFDELIYTKDELRTLETLNRELKQIKNELKVLNAIQYQTKKDGGEFSNLLKNIKNDLGEGLKMSAWFAGYNNSYIELSLSELKTSKNGVQYNEYSKVTIYDIESLEAFKNAVEKTKKSHENYIKELESDIKNIKNIYKIVYKFKKELEGVSYRTKESIKKEALYFF